MSKQNFATISLCAVGTLFTWGCGDSGQRKGPVDGVQLNGTLPLAEINLSHTVIMSKDLNPEISHRQAFSPVSAKDGKVFFVYGDANDRPFVSQNIAGVETTVPLDPNSDYRVLHDAHHTFSLGIDKNGYIHVAGDMHGYPGNEPGPLRYKNQTSMNWISNKPYDISAGFTFVGTKDAPTAIPANGITYPRFHESPTGELYFTAIVDAYKYGKAPATYMGHRGLGLYKYDADARTWNAIGDYPNVELYPEGAKWKVFFWEAAGVNEWFQGFIPAIEWDTKNRMHVSWSAVVDNNLNKPSRVFYVSSPDGGTTWQTIKGATLQPPPFRGAAGVANVPDVVFDSHGQGEVSDYTQIAVDGASVPLVYNYESWYFWNGQSWALQTAIPKISYGYYGFSGADGSIIFVHSGMRQLYRLESAGQATATVVDVAAYFDTVGVLNGWFYTPNNRGFQTDGVIYSVVINPTTLKQAIVGLKLSSSPVPVTDSVKTTTSTPTTTASTPTTPTSPTSKEEKSKSSKGKGRWNRT